MPLESGNTPHAIGKNIAAEIRAGKPAKQAEAIAYSKARGDADTDRIVVQGMGWDRKDLKKHVERAETENPDARKKIWIEDAKKALKTKKADSTPSDKLSSLASGVSALADSVDKLTKRFDSIAKKRADALPQSSMQYIQLRRNRIKGAENELKQLTRGNHDPESLAITELKRRIKEWQEEIKNA